MALRQALVRVAGKLQQLGSTDKIASDSVTESTVTGSGTPTNLFFTAARVLAVVLTGLSVVGPQAAVVSTDSILVAIGKLQAQITNLTTSAVAEGTNLYFTTARVLATALTGFSTAAGNVAVVATDTVLAAFGKLQGQINALGTMAYQTAAAAPYVNLMTDSGRGDGKINPLLLQLPDNNFTASGWFTAFNGSAQSDGGRFYHDNSTNGGASSAINSDVQALIAAMGRTGASARYGVEFRLFNFTAGTGTDVSYQGTDSTVRYLASTNNTRAFFAASGTATFAGWLRVKTGSMSFGGSYYLNGVLKATGTPITAAMGWVHVRRVGNSSLGYDNAFPYLVATASATFQIACPTFFSGQVDTGVHTSPIPTVNELSA